MTEKELWKAYDEIKDDIDIDEILEDEEVEALADEIGVMQSRLTTEQLDEYVAELGTCVTSEDVDKLLKKYFKIAGM